MKIGIIDYGVGNIGSVTGAFAAIGAEAVVVTNPRRMDDCHGLLLPGVGSFRECMNTLVNDGWSDEILSQIQHKGKPLLGICLGMQLLAELGWEGAESGIPCAGLGLVPGTVTSLENLGVCLRIPHVGWNSVSYREGQSTMFNGINQNEDFYFVHSYAFACDSPEVVVATSEYGVTFPVSIYQESVWGVQFHPEKSSKAGMQLLSNFSRFCKC